MMPGPWEGCILAPDGNGDLSIWRPLEHREPALIGRLCDLPAEVAAWVALLLEG